MTSPAKINFKLYQGSTFNEVLRWESSTKVYAPITNIYQSAPLVVTVENHGIPVDWRVKFTNILGMVDLNSSDTYHQVTETTTNTVTINSINSLAFRQYSSGGIVEYNKPIDLYSYTARMQIRIKIDDIEVVHEMTTENGGIILNNTTKTITLNIPASITSQFSFITAVYSLELIAASGSVTPFANGNITLVKEVTR